MAAPRDRGYLDSNGDIVGGSTLARDYTLDDLGNLTAQDVDGTASVVAHTTNHTNEITAVARANPAGDPKVVDDGFDSSFSELWSQDKGTWSVSSGKAVVDSLTSGDAVLLANVDLGMSSNYVELQYPRGTPTGKAGLVFGHDGNNSYYAVAIDRAAGTIGLYEVTSGSWSSAVASDSATFNDNAAYGIWVYRKQRYIYAAAIDLGGPGGGAMAEFEFNSTADLSPGMFGFYADQTTYEFAVAKAYDGAARESLVPRFRGLAESSISSGELLVEGSSRNGEAVMEGFSDDA